VKGDNNQPKILGLGLESVWRERVAAGCVVPILVANFPESDPFERPVWAIYLFADWGRGPGTKRCPSMNGESLLMAAI
jgi:hypothetical protein